MFTEILYQQFGNLLSLSYLVTQPSDGLWVCYRAFIRFLSVIYTPYFKWHSRFNSLINYCVQDLAESLFLLFLLGGLKKKKKIPNFLFIYQCISPVSISHYLNTTCHLHCPSSYLSYSYLYPHKSPSSHCAPVLPSLSARSVFVSVSILLAIFPCMQIVQENRTCIA